MHTMLRIDGIELRIFDDNKIPEGNNIDWIH